MIGIFTAKKLGRVVLLLTLGWTYGCAPDGSPRVKRIGLKSIEVRDSKAGSGEDEADPDDIDTDGGNPSDPQDSVTAFGLALYPSLKEYCGACHAQAQPPLFANPDKDAAHTALIQTSKVNFQDFEQSRIVLRVAKENHNCPGGDCVKAAEAFKKGISDWYEKINTKDDNAAKLPITSGLKFADAADSVIVNKNPPGVFYFEAEKGILKAPMVGVPSEGVNGGLYVHTPAGAGNQNTVATATNQANLGTVIYNFQVTVAGNYQVMGRIGSPNANASGIYVRMDAGAFQTWQFPMTGADFAWDKADPVVATGTPFSFNLAVGAHTMEIRQRREQVRVDALVVANDPNFDPATASMGDENVKKLTFDIGAQSGIAGAKLKVFVADYSNNAYIFRNPTIELPAGAKLKVKNLKLYINGKYLPQHATYTIVDTEVTGPEGQLSSSALVALKDKGNDLDDFSFEFEVLQSVP